MARETRTILKVTADVSDAKAGLTGVGRTAQKLTDDIEKLDGSSNGAARAMNDLTDKSKSQEGANITLVASFNATARAVGIITSALRSMNALIQDSISLAVEQEAAEIKLDQALQARGALTDENAAKFRALASEIQSFTTFGDESVLMLQRQLLATGTTVDELEKATRATVALAGATGKDLNTAGRIMAQVQAGQTSALKRYGIAVDATGDVMQQLIDNQGALALATNSTRDQLKRFSNSMGDLEEQIGLGITPIIKTFAKVLQPVVDRVGDWIKANRKIVSSKILEFVIKVARFLNGPVLSGLTFVAEAVQGLRVIWNLLNAAQDKAIQGLLQGLAEVLKTIAKVEGLIPGIGSNVGDAAKTVEALADSFGKSGDAGFEAAKKQIAGFAQIRKNAEAAQSQIAKLIDQTETLGKLAIEQDTSLGGGRGKKPADITGGKDKDDGDGEKFKTRLELIEMFEEQKRALMLETHIANQGLFAEIAESERAIFEQTMENFEATARSAQKFGASIGKVFGAMIAGQKSIAEGFAALGKLILSSVLDAVTGAVNAYLVEAIAAQYAANSAAGLPGLIAASAAAGVLGGIFAALIDQIPTAAHGGLVQGGIPGVDSVPILAQQGERILSVDQTRALDQGGGGGGTTIIINQTSLVGGINDEIERAIQERLLPMLMRAQSFVV